MSKRNDGFSVPELLIAMVIGLVVVGAVYSLFIMQNRQCQPVEQIARFACIGCRSPNPKSSPQEEVSQSKVV